MSRATYLEWQARSRKSQVASRKSQVTSHKSQVRTADFARVLRLATCDSVLWSIQSETDGLDDGLGSIRYPEFLVDARQVVLHRLL